MEDPKEQVQEMHFGMQVCCRLHFNRINKINKCLSPSMGFARLCVLDRAIRDLQMSGALGLLEKDYFLYCQSRDSCFE